MKQVFLFLLFSLCISCCKDNDMTRLSNNTQQTDSTIKLSNDVPIDSIYIEDGIDLNIKKLVPNKVTAFNIAIAVLSNIYGENQLESETPFNVYQRDSVWVVYGTQKHQKGGFSYIEIDARDGRVLKISHEE